MSNDDKNTLRTPAGLENLLRDIEPRPTLELNLEGTGGNAEELLLRTSGSTGMLDSNPFILSTPRVTGPTCEVKTSGRSNDSTLLQAIVAQNAPVREGLTIADFELPALARCGLRV